MKFQNQLFSCLDLKKKEKKDCGSYYQTVEVASSGHREEPAPDRPRGLRPKPETRAPPAAAGEAPGSPL